MPRLADHTPARPTNRYTTSKISVAVSTSLATILPAAIFTGVVNSVVKDLINPIIGLVIGGVDFSNIFVALNGQTYPNLDAAQKAGAPTLNVGLFINALINFLIIAFVVFWVGKAAARMMRREAAAPTVPPAPTRSEVLHAPGLRGWKR